MIEINIEKTPSLKDCVIIDGEVVENHPYYRVYLDGEIVDKCVGFNNDERDGYVYVIEIVKESEQSNRKCVNFIQKYGKVTYEEIKT